MNAIESFFDAKDRHGLPLFRDAHIVAEHDGVAVVDWTTIGADGCSTQHHRTLLDSNLRRSMPGISGDPAHVKGWLVSKRFLSDYLTESVNLKENL